MTIKERLALINKARISLFNAITFGSIIKEKLIFSDRKFLVDQLLTERQIDGKDGFNKISDYDFLRIIAIGLLETKKIMKKFEDTQK